MTSQPTPYRVARVADRVLASIEEFVHGNADQSDASFILGTALQTYAIENTVYKRQAIGSWRFCESDEQFAVDAGEDCHPIRASHPIPDKCFVVHPGI